ncbi:hypothetical protein [Azoarcus sp. DN11]|uniref:hypothetical protein n=1 Tax=Azoarcus sp. DN11 TaxID=356837 RepID=UPI000EF2D488|nr:hypothetical protein [Azoarcus sp. DN11]AYH42308.1 hypothetical protein CDA09_23040 [Azoarcus sp. DN11]
MDKDYLFYQGYIREAQRRRNEALGQLFVAGWQRTKRIVARLANAVLDLLIGSSPQPH